MIDTQLVNYRQFISIKNLRTNKYITIESPRLQANGSHPFLKINEIPLEMSSKVFQFVNAQNSDASNYSGPLLYGSQVLIYAVAGIYFSQQTQSSSSYFLVCQQTGELKVEKMTIAEACASKSTKFFIQDPNNFQSKRQVTIYDDVVFKFNETNYVINELNQQVSWTGTSVSIDTSWKVQKSNSPPMPDWIYLRPYVSLSFLCPQQDAILPQIYQQIITSERRTLGSYPQQSQQFYLIEDLLFCMMGIEGTYIRRRQPSISQKSSLFFEYAIEPNLDQPTCEISLQQMVNKILPLCSQHDAVEFYVQHKSRYENGLVSQALCSAMRVILKEYLTMVNQLDAEFNNGELTFQKLWYYLQPSLKVINALANLVADTVSLNGGVLLSKLFELIKNNTDRQVTAVYSFLAEKAAQPYVEMLSTWIYEGEVTDIYGEFLVQEKKYLQKSQISQEYRDNYWETRFMLRNNQIPKFLEKYKEIILRTGKYLNVVCESKRNNTLNPIRELNEKKNELIQKQDFSTVVLKAFDYANKQILDLLFKGEDLMGRLKTIKRFFMMESGDFFIHFVESAEEELSKPPKMVSREKLESLLDMAIRGVSCTDPYKDDITGVLDSFTVIEQVYAMQNLKGNESVLSNERSNVHSPGTNLRGLDLFTIDLRIQWPINLVLSRTSMVKYQIIFKSLFFFKYIERQLNKTWQLHQTVKELGIQGLFIKSHILLQQMIHFMKSYLFYMSYDVIEQNYNQMEAKLSTLETFEEVLTHHNNFVDTCLTQSLLLDQNWMKHFNRLTQCCLTFAKAMQRFTTTLTRNDQINFALGASEDFPSELNRRKYWVQQSREHVKQIITEQSYNNTVCSFQKTFNELSRDLTKMIYQKISNQNNFLTGLVTRLDFEGQYAGIQSFMFQQMT